MPDQPHIVLLMTDQQRADWTDYRPGNRRTPTWARVAQEGVTFACAFSQTPICTPSRCSIMTGTYPTVHRVLCHQNHAPDGLPQLPELLQQRGYHTIGTGHYESNRSLERGYDQAIDMAGTNDLDTALKAQYQNGSSDVGYSAGEHHLDGDQAHAAQMTNHTLACVDRADHANQPLLIHVAYIEPHPPFFCPKGWMETADAKLAAFAPEPGPLRPEWQAEARAQVGSDRATLDDLRRLYAAYGGMIRYADHHIGRLLDGLEQRGILDHAWVVLCSDHGDYLGEKGLYCKSEGLYDCLTRVPLVVRGPRGAWRPGTTCDGLAGLMDLFPTLLKQAGGDPLPQAQGVDLVDELDTHGSLQRDALFGAVGEYGGHLKTTMPSGIFEAGRRHGLVTGVRTREHVFIDDPDTGPEAYDLTTDPRELDNLLLADGPEPGWVAPLRDRLIDWRQACDAHRAALGVIQGDRNFDEQPRADLVQPTR